MKLPKILTDEQKSFIENNFKTMTDKDMAEELGLGENWILQYRCKNKMLKQIQKAKVINMDEGEFFNVNQKACWL